MKRSPTLVFEGGTLVLNMEGYADPGSGHFAFTEDDLHPLSEYDDEDGGRWDGFLAKLPASELVAIRDFLNTHLPAETDLSGPQGTEAALSVHDAPKPPLREEGEERERIEKAVREAVSRTRNIRLYRIDQRQEIVEEIVSETVSAILSTLQGEGGQGLSRSRSQPCTDGAPNPILTETQHSDGEER